MDLLTALSGPETRSDPLLNPWPWSGLSFNGMPLFGLRQTIEGDKETVPDTFEGYVRHAYQSSGVVFACEYVRLSIFSEARLAFRSLNAGKPGDLFYTDALDVVRRPWPGATTGNLLSRALSHADFAGNAFILRAGGRLSLLRPDWIDIVLGSNDPTIEDPVYDPEATVVGYLYHPGGKMRSNEPVAYGVDEVAHFAPVPDPLAHFRGMSWLTPVVRDVVADKQATQHKNKFYEKGATPNMILKGKWTDPDQLRKWTELFREKHEGAANAYKTLVLGEGMDAEVVGNNFQQLDFKAVQGAAETRIAAASGVGAVVAQLSEGLQGSSLNAGNYSAARRRVSDGLFRPLWRDFCGSLETVVPAPRNAELWYDGSDVSFLAEDAKDAADIEFVKAQTARQLIDGGFDPQSVVAAVTAQDLSLLAHTGKVSVQLQDPNATSVDGTELTPQQASNMDLPEDYKERFETVGALIRAGFEPQSALKAVGLDPIDHLGLVPVTVKSTTSGDEEPINPDLGASE